MKEGNELLELGIKYFNESLSEGERTLKRETLKRVSRVGAIYGYGKENYDFIENKLLEKIENLQKNIHELFKTFSIDEDIIKKNSEYIDLATWRNILHNKKYSNELITEYKEKFHINGILKSNRGFRLRDIALLYEYSYIGLINAHLDNIIGDYVLNEEEIEDVIQLSNLASNGYQYYASRCEFINTQRITKKIYLNNLHFFHLLPDFMEELENNKFISDELRTIIKLKNI
ncbi:hypothetical protein Bp8pS_240 [Bacillus phage vB_BpuM-BpSp]|nr:hypothetical protein Bp8pS_240 [Bacillus phage vB_BpuM-BpSp]